MKKGVNTAMKFDSVKYFLRDALKSIKRNKTLSIASTATVAATFFILGLVILSVVNVNKAVDELGSKVEARIYLKDNVTNEQKYKLQKALQEVPGVVDVKLETKEQALAKVKDQLDDEKGSLVAGFDKKNPFPSSYIVRVQEPKIVDTVVEKVKDFPGIEKVKDAREVIDKVSRISDSATIIGISFSVIFVLVSLFLIGNTIKITVFSRKREIGIMKYVGATDWFIRWPFIIEGVILGLIGSLVSIVLLYLVYFGAQAKVGELIVGFSVVPSTYILTSLLWKFILGGMVIGSLGSILSMRKFLKV